MFSIKSIGSSPAIFDVDKLDYFNAYYLRKKTVSELIILAKNDLEKAGLESQGDFLEKAVFLAKDRIKKVSDLPELISFLFKKPVADESLIIWKNISLETAKNNLREVFDFMLTLNSWEREDLEREVLKWIKENKDGRNGDYLWPLRTALSGLKNSPNPFEIAWVLGREESKKRVTDVLSK